MAFHTKIILKAAKPYVAGATLAEALEMADRAAERGYGVTLGYWHGAGDSPAHVADAYLEALKAIAQRRLDARLAMKVPGLGGHRDLLGAVFSQAQGQGVGVDIDSHSPEEADDAFAAAALAAPGVAGIAIPGRWAHAPDLADRAMAMGLRVRVVKGQWKDPQAPRLDPGAGFLATIDRLAGRAREVAVAAHDPALAKDALARLTQAGTPVRQELLYGLPMEPSASLGAAANVPARIYIPYGHAWVPYSVKKALTSPAAMARFFRDLSRGTRDGLPPMRETRT